MAGRLSERQGGKVAKHKNKGGKKGRKENEGRKDGWGAGEGKKATGGDRTQREHRKVLKASKGNLQGPQRTQR